MPYASEAFAQIDQPIVEVRLEQEGQVVTDPFILSLVATTVGKPLSMRDVRETTSHFMSLSRFADVRSYAESTTGGVRLRYELLPLHPIDRLEFRGRVGVSEDELERLVQERFSSRLSAARADAVVLFLRDAYRRRGYPLAKITSRIEETHDPDRATMILDVDAGTRAIIAEVMYAQTEENEAGALIGRPTIETRRPYVESEVNRELERWVERMRDRGYYEARASHGVQFPDDAYVTVNFARGPLVTIAFSGDPLPEDEREELVPVRAEGSADEDLLEDSARNIETYFFARGYRDADVRYTPAEKNGELVITFDINRGPRYVIGEVDISGNTALTAAELRELLQMMGGDLFVEAVLDRGVAAVRAAYRARGFTQVTITPNERVIVPEDARSPDRTTDISIPIVEGPRTVVRSVRFDGNMALSQEQLQGVIALAPGRPYSDADVVMARDRLDLEYRNRGYDSVVVKPEIERAEGDTQADVTFHVAEGPQTVADHIIILGNERTNRQTIERELLLREGEPIGYAAVIESRARLMALGLFSGVQIEPVEQSAGGGRRDVIVRVQESPVNSIGFGGGIEGAFVLQATGEGGAAEERFEAAPRGFFQIGRRNLWGSNRAVNLFTRVSLRSRDRPTTATGGTVTTPDASDGGPRFYEYRVIGDFREPRAFGTFANLLITGVLEQAKRSSFNFSRRIARVESATELARGYTLAGRYSFEKTRLFDERFAADEKPLIDRHFPEVRLSKVAVSFYRDTRDDIVDTERGTWLIVDAELAARALGSEVGFVTSYIQGFTFFRLPTTRRVIAAFSARLGAAQGFARQVGDEVVDDLPASERFFAGGDTTVRGFSLDRLGNEATISQSGFPIGGNSVVILNGELRVNVTEPLQAVGFIDGGNVFPRASDFDLTDLRPAAGAGIRYRLPFGMTIRFDLGFNLKPRELVPGTRERRTVPHISIGQAF